MNSMVTGAAMRWDEPPPCPCAWLMTDLAEVGCCKCLCSMARPWKVLLLSLRLVEAVCPRCLLSAGQASATRTFSAACYACTQVIHDDTTA